MTPLHLLILVQACTTPEPLPNWYAPATQEYARQLVEMGVIEVKNHANDVPCTWTATLRGRAWLDLILETPMPVCRWVDPRQDSAADMAAAAAMLDAQPVPATGRRVWDGEMHGPTEVPR